MIWRRQLCGGYQGWEKMPGTFATREAAFQGVGALELQAGIGEWTYTIWPEGKVPPLGPEPLGYRHRMMSPNPTPRP